MAGSWAQSCSWASQPTLKQADSDLGQCHDTESAAPYTKRRWRIRTFGPFWPCLSVIPELQHGRSKILSSHPPTHTQVPSDLP
jgi:hypothetical protein